MTRHALFGPLLAAVAALVISPDTLMMRLSGLDGVAMMFWRGGLTAVVLLGVWIATARDKRRDFALLCSAAGATVAVCQFLNATVFSLSVAVSPVSVVLFGVATVPVCAALFARLLLGEPTERATWVTICTVLVGIGIAVFGHSGGDVAIDTASLLGALGGLVVAATLSLNFVVLRAHPDLPILLTIGTGALMTGVVASAASSSEVLLAGEIWPIAITGAVLLPASFFMLSFASRHTHAANVSLMLLLETAFGPLLVWAGVGEAPTPPMFLGGAIVIVSIALYLLHRRRVAARVI